MTCLWKRRLHVPSQLNTQPGLIVTHLSVIKYVVLVVIIDHLVHRVIVVEVFIV